MTTLNIRKYLLVPILAVLALLMIRESVGIVKAIFSPTPPLTVTGNLEMYLWTAVGVGIYAVLRILMHKNMRWLEVFSHELTHAVVSLMMLRKVHSLKAQDNGGEVSTSGKGITRVFVTLAPYCLPIFTYFFLFFRPLIKFDGLWIYDMVVGITVGFHAMCFKTQTGNHQPDINQFPKAFAYLYIFSFLLFNINTILVSYWSSKNIFTALVYTLSSIWEGLTAFFHLFF